MKTKQRTLWLLAAMAAPLAHFSGTGWMATLLASAAILPLSLLPKSWETTSKSMALVRILWLGAVAGILLRGSGAYWPSKNEVVVPLTLLALAAVTNSSAAPRIGAVLALVMGLLAIPLAVSGAARIEPGWLKPFPGSWSWGLALTLLLPNLPAAKSGTVGGTACVGLVAVLLSALVQGTIGANVAAAVPDPFYQTARTLGYLEPVAAAAVTLGWYAVAVYHLESAKIIAAESEMGRIWATVLVTGTAAAMVLFKVQPKTPFWSLFGLFLWVLCPFLTKMKKVEKT